MTAVTGSPTELGETFRMFAEYEFAGHSPLYERLSYAVADQPDLAAPLLAAPPRQRLPLLYFAAISYVLATTASGHALANWYPSLGGQRPADDGDSVAALADLVGGRIDEIAAICARRTTQTNEPNRACLLRPAFGRVAEAFGGAPLALIEMGTSAGILLLPDRFGYRYHRDGRSVVYGDGWPLDCALRSDQWPGPAGTPLAIASRTGVDLAPIHVSDPAERAWLRACIWPEHLDRVARLDRALAEVAAVEPVLVTGDFRSAVPALVAAADGIPCVFASHALLYLDATGRAEVVSMLADLGGQRDMAVIVNEGSRHGVNLFAADAPRLAGDVRTTVTVVFWRGGAATVEVLGEGAPHGTWLSYDPHGYPYRPAV